MRDVVNPYTDNPSFDVTWKRPNNMRIWSRGVRTNLAPADVMIHFSIDYIFDSPGRKFSFVAPLSTFVKPDIPPSTSPKVYTWPQWGPMNTHFCQSDTIFEMVHVSGFHAIHPKGDVLDFNPSTIARFSSGRNMPEDAILVDSGCHTIDRPAVFPDRIHTSMPYILYPAPAIRAYHQEESPSYWKEFYAQDTDGIKMVRLRYPPQSSMAIAFLDVCFL
ncbi:hypothetical protein K474DRAFT_98949 [Panus rudis PR-1116 ss-1]|nr:hypothetical protein K474DRAFT_98949 [Panus rudis PR-1116 ss-1]